MPPLVTSGASMLCSFGVAPSTLAVPPVNRVMAGAPAATIIDNVPMANIPPFGMCNSIANPVVAAATAAKLGVFSPMPCVPVVPAPWAPGSAKVRIGNVPALTASSTCMCAWGGSISITAPGQVTTSVT